MSTAAAPTQSAPVLTRTSPYQGLRPYTEEDAAFFFGRDEWRDIIIDNLLAHPLTLLYGESGVGKSSVLRAGVLPELRRRHSAGDRPPLAAAVFEDWRDPPIEGLSNCMAAAVAQALGDQSASLSSNGSLSDRLDGLADRLGGRLILILDQFEQYFVYQGRTLSAESLAAQLPHAVGEHNLRVHYLIAIREDALAKLDAFQDEIPSLFDNLLRIAPLDRDAATDAIAEPVKRYNKLYGTAITVEPKLISTVIDEIDVVGAGLEGAGRAGTASEDEESGIQAPYLQVVMQRLWDEETKAGSSSLRLDTLKRLGGSTAIVRHHLDQAMDTLTPDERVIAARIFHFLVTPSGTKFAHTAVDLADYTGISSTAISGVLEKLAAPQVRILRRVAPPPQRRGDDQEPPPRYEIYHDALGPAVLDWRIRQLALERPSLGNVWLITFVVNTIVLGTGLGVFVMIPLLRKAKPPVRWRNVWKIVGGWVAGFLLGAIVGAAIGAAGAAAAGLHGNKNNGPIGFGVLLGADVFALLGAMFVQHLLTRNRD